MNILMLSYEIVERSANYIRCLSLARGLVRLGHTVTLMAAGRNRSLRSCVATVEPGLRVMAMPGLLPNRARNGGFDPLDLAARLMASADARWDIVHAFSHRPTAAVAARLISARLRIPWVADWSDLWGFGGIADERQGLAGRVLGWLDQAGERRTYLCANAVTVITHTLYDRARCLGVSAQRIYLLPVGANIDWIRPLPRLEARQKLGLPRDGKWLVHSGQAPYDAEFLAWSFVEIAGRNADVRLVLTGHPLPRLDRIIEEAGLGQRVIRLGYLPYQQLGEALGCADMLLLPYTKRSVNLYRYPNKAGDYLAAGRPIVTHATGDLGLLVAQEKVGLLAGETPAEFAEAVERLLDDPDWGDEMGQRGRQLAETRLDWNILAAGLADFYESVLNFARRTTPAPADSPSSPGR